LNIVVVNIPIINLRFKDRIHIRFLHPSILHLSFQISFCNLRSLHTSAVRPSLCNFSVSHWLLRPVHRHCVSEHLDGLVVSPICFFGIRTSYTPAHRPFTVRFCISWAFYQSSLVPTDSVKLKSRVFNHTLSFSSRKKSSIKYFLSLVLLLFRGCLSSLVLWVNSFHFINRVEINLIKPLFLIYFNRVLRVSFHFSYLFIVIRIIVRFKSLCKLICSSLSFLLFKLDSIWNSTRKNDLIWWIVVLIIFFIACKTQCTRRLFLSWRRSVKIPVKVIKHRIDCESIWRCQSF